MDVVKTTNLQETSVWSPRGKKASQEETTKQNNEHMTLAILIPACN